MLDYRIYNVLISAYWVIAAEINFALNTNVLNLTW